MKQLTINDLTIGDEVLYTNINLVWQIKESTLEMLRLCPYHFKFITRVPCNGEKCEL